MKPSIGGVKARRFISKIISNDQERVTKPKKSTYRSKIQYQQWKRLHNAVKDQEGSSRNAKAKVWQTIDVLFQMCEKVKWTNEDKKRFQENLQAFKKSFSDAWTHTQITHYMVRQHLLIIILYNYLSMQHIMYNHMPF